MFINVYSKGRYPTNCLSNFYPHTFNFDGFENSPCMEAFLQSLKFEDTIKQRCVLYMDAKEAKAVGNVQPWEKHLYWNGRKLVRYSKEYIDLVESAYRSLLANPDFRQALIDSGKNILLHTIGKTLRSNTVLTWWEFTGILNRLRKEVIKNG